MLLKKGFVFAGCFAAFLSLAACGDDDSSFATRPSDGSSSSVCEDCDDGYSSSAKSSNSSAKSSGSVYRSGQCKIETDEDCFKDDRDGQTYKTVKIGDQVWMAENLNYEMDSSFCYNDSAEYCEKYGRLYLWNAAMDGAGVWSENGKGCGYSKTCSPTYPVRGVCPEGWHLPSKAEWLTLFDAVGGQSTAGKVLKSTSGWDNEKGDGTDAFGFSALPAGYRANDGDYTYGGKLALFWSSTEGDSGSAYFMGLLYNVDNAFPDANKDYGSSVRCLKD